MTWVTPSIIAVLAGSSILTLAYFYLAMQERDRSLLIWAFAWAFQVIRYLFDLVHTLTKGQSPALHSVLQTGNYLAAIATGFLLLWGTHVFMGKKLPRWWVIVIVATSAWVLSSGLFFFSFMASTLPTFTLQGIVFIMTGMALLRHRELGKAARTITGWAFIIWGTHKLEYFIARQIKALVPWGYLLSAVLEVVVALGIIVAYFQKTRDKLIESEERYHSLFEKCQSIMLIIDPKTGAYLDANTAACSYYGYTREEMKKKFLWDINNRPREELFEQIELTLKGKGSLYQFQHSLAGGEVRDVEVYVGPIKYDGHEVFFSVVHDITDRKRAEDALRTRESVLQKIFEILPVGLWFADKDGKLLRGNPAGVKIWGAEPKVDPSEYGVFKARRLPSGEEVASDDWALAHTIKDKVTIVDELLEIDAFDGKKKTIINYTAPVLDAKGDIQGAIVVNQDVTERKEFEEVLKNASAQWNATFDAIRSPVLLLDKERNVLRCNAAAAKILQKPFSEIIGRHCYELFHGLADPPEECRFTYMMGNGWEDIRVVQLGNRTCEMLLYPWLESDGRIQGAVHILTDVTTRKEEAEKLRASREELRNLAAHLQNVREEERTYVAREIHDELIQALTALKMDVSWIRDKLEKPPARDRILAMMDLIKKTMKTVHRISAELRPGMLDDLGLSAAVDWQVKEFQQKTGIRCHLRMEPDEIILDRKRSTALFRILQESLANIYRHAKASRIDVRLRLKDDFLTMKVKDNGLGITEEQRTASGSFGLIGMRERALVLGGDIGINGVPGKGTTILVRMPVRAEEGMSDDKNTHS